MSDKPNILMLVIDCLRADHVYEEGIAHIPAVRALMERGFAFRNAISTTTTTTPSFASMLTGRYPFEHGVRTHHGGKLSESVAVMPQLLQQAGYHTYAEACGPLGVEVGMNRGFDEYVHRGRRAVITGAWGKELMEKLGGGHYQEPWFLMLHVWALHQPRQILPERKGRECGQDGVRAVILQHRPAARTAPRRAAGGDGRPLHRRPRRGDLHRAGWTPASAACASRYSSSSGGTG